MSLHRFFLPRDSFRGQEVVFTPEAGRQIRSVLRLRRNDPVLALDGQGREFLVRLDQVERQVTGTVEEQFISRREPQIELTVYQGMLKGPRFELVLQKCTELGASRFIPMETSRAVADQPNESKLHRLEAIIREASEQCGRGRLPALERMIPFAKAVERARGEGVGLLFWENENECHIRDVEFDPLPEKVGVFIGPEGGFSDNEVTKARRGGLDILSMGNRILRAETAAILATGLVLERLGELG